MLWKILATVISAASLLRGQPVPPPVVELPKPRCCNTRPPGRIDDVAVTTGEFPSGSANEAARLAKPILRLAGMMDPPPDGAADALRANEDTIPRVFQIKIEGLQAYDALHVRDHDVLMARWRASGPFGVRSVGVYDEYASATYIVDCDYSALNDPRKLVSGLFAWRTPPVYLDWLNVQRGVVEEPSRIVLSGVTHVSRSPMPAGQAFSFGAFSDEGRVKLAVTVGKRTLDREIARYRFPPLSKTVESMSTGGILETLRQLGRSDDQLGLFGTDASVLIHELVRRQVTDDDLFAATYASANDGGLRGVWLGVLIRELGEAGDIARRQPLLIRILDNSAKQHIDCFRQNCSVHVFNAARAARLDFEQTALAYALSAKSPEFALQYLGEVSSSPATLDAIKKLQFAGHPGASFREEAIRTISMRIDNQHRSLSGPSVPREH